MTPTTLTDEVVALVVTEKGVLLALTEEPRWNEFHNCYYAGGFRFIKTKGKFSTNCGLHNFKTYTRKEVAR